MERTKISKIWLVLFAVVLCFGPVGLAEPVGTAFTYQGRLIDTNQPGDGLYDLQFKLYDSVSDGNKIGGDVNSPETQINDGYFTVEMDFGGAFDGNNRWLEIGARPGIQSDPNTYTALTPRQKLTATPYAIYAKTAGGGGGGGADSDWIISGNNMYSGVSGNVGIGTASPAAKLEVNGGISASSINTNSISAGPISASSITASSSITTNSTYKIAGATVLSVPGTGNTLIGLGAGLNNTGYYNTFSGNGAGYSNTTGNYNTFLGHACGYSNTTGNENTFLGFNAGYSNNTGNYNTFSGKRSGYLNNSGSDNTFSGFHAGFWNNGSRNTYLGREAGATCGDVNDNTFVGYMAGYSSSSGNNSFFGSGAGQNNTSGSSNTFSGYRSGYSNTTGSGNVFLGYRAGFNEAGSNKLYIANSDINNLIYGDFSNGRVGIGTTDPTEKLDVSGTARLRQISTTGDPNVYAVVADSAGKLWKTVSSKRYKTNIAGLETNPDAVLQLRPVSFQYKASGQQDIGLIAEEVGQVIQDLVVYDAEGRPDAVKYDKVALYLLSVVKNQQEEIAALKERIAQDQSLEQRVKTIESLVKKLSQQQEGGIK